MRRLLAAPVTELRKLDLPLNLLLVLMRIIIPPFADGATHRYQSVSSLYLSHEGDNN